MTLQPGSALGRDRAGDQARAGECAPGEERSGDSERCHVQLELAQFRAQVSAAAGAVSARGRPPTSRPPPAGGNDSTTEDRASISLRVALPLHAEPRCRPGPPQTDDRPRRETRTGCRGLARPFDATNGMEPDDARVGACSDVLRNEHEIVD